jgi:RNA polymerase sigma factor (TIGR02999 family)
MVATRREQVTQILQDWNDNSSGAAERLMPLVYDELRRLARGYLQRERSGHTLQATEIVHEAFMRLVEQESVKWQSRAHFFRIAAQMMRRILVDHTRRQRAEKRGGEWNQVEFDHALGMAAPRHIDIIALDEALRDLARLNPQHSDIVELRFFGGMTIEEVASVLGVSARTVQREWRMAKAWLQRQIFSPEHDYVGR